MGLSVRGRGQCGGVDACNPKACVRMTWEVQVCGEVLFFECLSLSEQETGYAGYIGTHQRAGCGAWCCVTIDRGAKQT